MLAISRVSWLLVFLACATAVAGAGAPRPSNPCANPVRRQFDFWVGSWRVVDASGKPQGTNHVTLEFGGCALQEHWAGVGGDRGSSFNSYLPGARKWQQTWVDNSGLTLRLLGGLRNGMMVLEGDRVDSKGEKLTDRIVWTPLRDGRVRQHWDESVDGGTHWKGVFDGYYIRVN